jgi:hypothetical protein
MNRKRRTGGIVSEVDHSEVTSRRTATVAEDGVVKGRVAMYSMVFMYDFSVSDRALFQISLDRKDSHRLIGQ